MNCSLQGSSVHGILQARVLEWVAISFSRGSSWLRDRTRVSHIAGGCFAVWATREALRAVLSAYLRLSIFLLAILIPACASSSLAFHLVFSAYKLNKQGDNIQPQCTPFPISNQSVVPCPVLTVASWPAYNFLRRQVRWSGIPISLRIFQFVVIHTVYKIHTEGKKR